MKLLLCLVLLGLRITASHAGEQEDLAKLRQRISALQQEVEKTSESKVEAADALRDSERAISDSNRKLNGLARQQLSASNDLAQIRQQASRLNEQMQDQRAQLSALLYRQYLDGHQEYLLLLLNDRDPDQSARNLKYFEYIARDRNAWLIKLRADLDMTETLSHRAKQKSDEISALQQEEVIQRQHLEQDRHTRQQTLQKISMQLKRQSREIDHLQRNEKRLSQLVEKLTHLLAQSGGSFDTLKGRLPMPVKGKSGNRFGALRPDGRMQWKGWFLPTPSGQEVKAIADGRVVFADWLRGFGNLLIIDHGKGYMSLYGYNETLYKQVGDTLKAGEVIATTGSSGGNGGTGLYFELRHEGTPLDPAPWITKRQSTLR